MGAPLVPVPASDWTFAVKQPVNQGFDDCAFPARPGQLFNLPNPALAQTPMAGGGGTNPLYVAKEWPDNSDVSRAQVPFAGGKRSRRRQSRLRRLQYGGDSNLASHAYTAKEWPQTANTALVQTTGMSGGGCPCASGSRPMGGGRRRGSRRQRGGGCGCSGSRLFGGGRRSTRRMRGGASYGFAINPSMSIGGTGPNVDAVRTPIPCDARAGAPNSLNQSGLSPDPRAGGFGYSATPNQTTPSLQAGGAFSSGNAYGAECYKAPGSMLPTYEAQTAGFSFRPSTVAGGTLPDGVTAYNDVVPYAARMGGGRRRKHRRYSRKHSHKRRH
jgi:hypothetical protein